ncbi:adenylate/guanylate cyclase domain-containing protein [Candidatus Nitrosocosmicus franklandus]|uniref:Adenylate cyclase n=1 Tax=Candidatus Nitrosocosmicus franklandianus TaxID=1798806 RepID=A0A484I739_9ARCH|nr:adenylate/guanylate cyclase domain-containing protein [Candidatus Nitrosocosmicus franklandus]VFJ13549.1 Adenylate cyclase [Candidatus Nitrosocosmicus franklandus]
MNSINARDIEIHPHKTIISLYESNIPVETIALQLDLSIEEINDAICKYQEINKVKEESVIQVSKVPKLGMLLVETVFDIESAIKDAQMRTWYNLKVKSQFNISQEKTQELLENFIGTNVTLVILHVDLVCSTDLSMNLPLKRLVPIIQAFTQEMSLVIEAYGGYVLKYVGDAIICFFFTEKDDLYLPCTNAVACAHSMITIIQEGMNTILESNGYTDLGVRIGIDIGENAIVQYGLRPETVTITENLTNTVATNQNYEKRCDGVSNDKNVRKKNGITVHKKPYLDILGYTINIASKMTSFARPNQIIIGEEVYRNLDIQTNRKFKKLNIKNLDWNYLNNATGNTYELYVNNDDNQR